MPKDNGKYLGSIMMFGFGAIALYRWHQTQLIFFLLLVLRDFAAGYFFLKRTPAEKKSGKAMSGLAYISSAMPLLYLSPTAADKELLFTSDIMAILGFLIVALATIEIGTSIGISPAKREYVQTGIYKRIKHPMYTGYVVSELGLCLINPLNVVIAGFSLSLYKLRAQNEQKIITQPAKSQEKLANKQNLTLADT